MIDLGQRTLTDDDRHRIRSLAPRPPISCAAAGVGCLALPVLLLPLAGWLVGTFCCQVLSTRDTPLPAGDELGLAIGAAAAAAILVLAWRDQCRDAHTARRGIESALATGLLDVVRLQIEEAWPINTASPLDDLRAELRAHLRTVREPWLLRVDDDRYIVLSPTEFGDRFLDARPFPPAACEIEHLSAAGFLTTVRLEPGTVPVRDPIDAAQIPRSVFFGEHGLTTLLARDLASPVRR